jgi:general secretion pathway protein H
VRPFTRGFTLLELLVVVALVALATAGVGLALRDTAGNPLEREGQRLVALLEQARAQARATGVPLRWQAGAEGFTLGTSHRPWLTPGTTATVEPPQPGTAQLWLPPEPLMPPTRLRLGLPGQTLWLGTDGLRPWSVVPAPEATP